MSEARRIIEQEPDIAPGTLIIANCQTSGYGRFKRKWFSPEGGLYFSLILEGKLEPSFTLVTGLAVVEALEDRFKIKLGLSWPNDVLLKGQKLAGVICETISDFTVLGIGINTFPHNNLPSELNNYARTIPISSVERGKLIALFISNLSVYYERFIEYGFQTFKELYENKLTSLGEFVEVINGDKIHSGIVHGVDNSGALVIENGNKKSSFISAEITAHEFKNKKIS